MTKAKSGAKATKLTDSKLTELWLDQVHAKVAQEAHKAFYSGATMHDCPYPQGSDARTWWLDVWHNQGYTGCNKPFNGIGTDRRWVNKGTKGDS